MTSESINRVCEQWGVSIHHDETEDYETLLAEFRETADALMQLPDYVLPVDLVRFPREDLHFPPQDENRLGAWARRCTIKDTSLPAQGGLLSGKKLAIKDNISVKDMPMLIGTEMVKGYVPNIDATVVIRILLAGGQIEGKSVCENLCHSALSSSAPTGPVHNPYARGYSSGGSFSGSGALVANDDVDMAFGADQGGSIRVPAGWCGMYGLKPTYGLVPYTDCGSNELTNDHVGPMSLTVLDNALLLQAIAGNDNIDDRSFDAPPPAAIPKYHDILRSLSNPQDLSGVRIGIIREAFSEPSLDPRVANTVRSAISRFTSRGASVSEINIPFHAQGSAIWSVISKVGGYFSKRPYVFGRHGHIMDDLNAQFHQLSQEKWDNAWVSTNNIFISGAYAVEQVPGLLGKATNLSRRLRDEYDAALERCDVLVLPNVPYIANSHIAETDGPLKSMRKQARLLNDTSPFNQSGHPALAMPIGMLPIEEGPLEDSGISLPVSTQIVGKW